jgi:hypothetical protein
MADKILNNAAPSDNTRVATIAIVHPADNSALQKIAKRSYNDVFAKGKFAREAWLNGKMGQPEKKFKDYDVTPQQYYNDISVGNPGHFAGKRVVIHKFNESISSPSETEKEAADARAKEAAVEAKGNIKPIMLDDPTYAEQYKKNWAEYCIKNKINPDMATQKEKDDFNSAWNEEAYQSKF